MPLNRVHLEIIDFGNKKVLWLTYGFISLHFHQPMLSLQYLYALIYAQSRHHCRRLILMQCYYMTDHCT